MVALQREQRVAGSADVGQRLRLVRVLEDLEGLAQRETVRGELYGIATRWHQHADRAEPWGIARPIAGHLELGVIERFGPQPRRT